MHSTLAQALDPVPYAPLRYRERGEGNLPCSLPPLRRSGPWKECENRTWVADFITVIEVVGFWVVVVHGELDQSKPQEVGVEIDVLLRFPGNGGYMMYAEYLLRHRIRPPRSLFWSKPSANSR